MLGRAIALAVLAPHAALAAPATAPPGVLLSNRAIDGNYHQDVLQGLKQGAGVTEASSQGLSTSEHRKDSRSWADRLAAEIQKAGKAEMLCNADGFPGFSWTTGTATCLIEGLADRSKQTLLRPGTRLLVYGQSHHQHMFLIFLAAMAHYGVLLDVQTIRSDDALYSCVSAPSYVYQARSTENSSVTIIANNPFYQASPDAEADLRRISQVLEAGAFTHILFSKPHEPQYFAAHCEAEPGQTLDPAVVGDRVEAQCISAPDKLEETVNNEVVVDFDGCMRKSRLWRTFERYARASGARLIDVVPHYVNQDMSRIDPGSLALFPNTKKHGCSYNSEQHGHVASLMGHVCAVFCGSTPYGQHCELATAADNAAEALDTVYHLSRMPLER